MHDELPIATLPIDGRSLATANRQVLWGWKRDVGRCFRVVYFSGRLTLTESGARLGYRHFFYRHRLRRDDAEYLRDLMAESTALAELGIRFLLTGDNGGGLADLTVSFGEPEAADRDRTTRLQRRRPRRRLNDIAPAVPARSFDPGDIFPADLYVGSGLSYEAGLPTLCDVHNYFGVDREDNSDFTVGREDPLPPRLAADPLVVLRDFCRVHTAALSAEPTPAMRIIRSLHDRGLIGKVFTDNVDNLLAKVGVPFERTRGSGVFNERYPAEFDKKNLIVIGVAADRRMLVRQARNRRGKVIVVNPCAHVAPRVRHLDYLRADDLFLKTTADDFFAEVDRQLAADHDLVASPAIDQRAYGT